jgi:hypothetical protein
MRLVPLVVGKFRTETFRNRTGRPLVYRLRWACWIAWKILDFRASGTGSLHRLDTTVRTRISNAYVSLHVLHFATSA